jgi:DNA invertase Pin-like site-specific DNA recombinase
MEGQNIQNISHTNARVRYCLYARKSTESDEKQALSIDSQINEMTQIADRLNLNIVCTKRESYSAKASGKRPVFAEIIKEINEGKFNGILTWAPDRLSRNAGDLGSLVDLMDEKKLEHIQTYGQTFSNSPNEKFLLMILCSQAKLENDNKSVNVKRGMRARCEMGLWPCRPPTGYTKSKRTDRKCESIVDLDRAPVIKEMFEKVGLHGWTGRKLHQWLKYEIDFKTEYNKHLSLGNLYRILQNHFYYGRFEYPKKSNNWYDGVHKPIIDKQLFDIVQEQIQSQTLEPRSAQKEFSFTKIMKCGLCGSGITADEKFKQLKDGGINRYVYYQCCKSRDQNCKNQAINEIDLIDQLKLLVDDLDIKSLPMRGKINSDVQRIKKFYAMIFDEKTQIHIKNINVRDYAKFILQEGKEDERREFLSCLTSNLLLDNKQVKIE